MKNGRKEEGSKKREREEEGKVKWDGERGRGKEKGGRGKALVCEKGQRAAVFSIHLSTVASGGVQSSMPKVMRNWGSHLQQ